MDPKAIKKLQGYIKELERLADETKGLAEQRSAIFENAKASGFNVKAIREVLKLRAQDTEERVAHESVREMYCKAMGLEMQSDLFG